MSSAGRSAMGCRHSSPRPQLNLQPAPVHICPKSACRVLEALDKTKDRVGQEGRGV